MATLDQRYLIPNILHDLPSYELKVLLCMNLSPLHCLIKLNHADNEKDYAYDLIDLPYLYRSPNSLCPHIVVNFLGLLSNTTILN